MDRLRSIEADTDIDRDYPVAAEPRMEAPPAIGTDERRMHVRAYNYWVSLLGGRAYPSIEDIDPAGVEDFGPHSVLLDFTAGPENPSIPFLGRALRDEGGHDGEIIQIADVPSGSLISRLTDHYLEIIANRAPIGFEAEFVNKRGNNTMYRGILMPFSSTGADIDFIYGVINWKEFVAEDENNELMLQVGQALRNAIAPPASPVWADGPSSDPAAGPTDILPEARYRAPIFPVDPGEGLVLDEGVPARMHDGDLSHVLPEAAYEASVFADDADGDEAFDPDAALADRLAAARETAEALKGSDARSRAALYRALACAYAFAVATEIAPEDYAELLEDYGLKAQARAPMTPVVKLVFGAEYDKTRLTEFAAVLNHGRRVGVPFDGMRGFLDGHAGGIKGIVAAERAARRPAEKPPAADARALLRMLEARGFVDLGPVEEEFVLLVARREADGRVAVLAPVTGDAAMVERALRRVAR